ncbi:hypothetical protein J7L13_00630, partial [bacterium]|nr:hypothetical protein [bacterium]
MRETKIIKAASALFFWVVTAFFILWSLSPRVFLKAATSFYASYDSSLDADQSLGNSSAFSTSSPSFISPGYNGEGQAIQFSQGNNLYYATLDNLNPSEGQISIWFKNSFFLENVQPVPLTSGVINDLYFDATHGYLYALAGGGSNFNKSAILKLKPDLSEFYAIGAPERKIDSNQIWGLWVDESNEHIY